MSEMPAATKAAICREKFMMSARLTRCLVTSIENRLLRARLIFWTSRLRTSNASRANDSLTASSSSFTLVPSAVTAVYRKRDIRQSFALEHVHGAEHLGDGGEVVLHETHGLVA